MTDDRPAEEITYEETRNETARFKALLDKYDGDFQKAVDADRRGEQVDLDGEADTNSPL
ncbi:MAG TPA: hypothetical protein VFZ17_12755 [Acidimicrobiia bacterium]|nr:hypothetical protein [Acidimicrobiia bacterium]